MNSKIAGQIENLIASDWLERLQNDHLQLIKTQPTLNLLQKHRIHLKRLFMALEYAIYHDQYQQSILAALWKCLQLLGLIEQKAIAFAAIAFQNYNHSFQWSFLKWYRFYLFGLQPNWQNPEVKIWTLYHQNLFWNQFKDPIQIRDQIDQSVVDSFQLGQTLIDQQLKQLSAFYHLISQQCT